MLCFDDETDGGYTHDVFVNVLDAHLEDGEHPPTRKYRFLKGYPSPLEIARLAAY